MLSKVSVSLRWWQNHGARLNSGSLAGTVKNFASGLDGMHAIAAYGPLRKREPTMDAVALVLILWIATFALMFGTIR